MTITATQRRSRAAGLALALGVGVASIGLAAIAPWAPALLVAILFGIAVRNLRLLPAALLSSAARWTRPVLRFGIVVLGLQLSIFSLAHLGWQGLLVIVVTVAVTFGGTLLAGRALRVPHVSSMLIATGFAICGASAVAAMSAVIDPDEEAEDDTAQAIALVTIFGTVCLFVLPTLQALTPFNDEQMGLWIGASVHEVAQVVASAGAVSAAAMAVATVAKLGRVVLLAPLVAAVGLLASRNRPKDPAKSRPPIVPLFVLGFIGTMLVRSFVPIPTEIIGGASLLATWLLASAMFGLGVAVDLPHLVRTGGRAMVLGTVATLIALIVSFLAILWTGAAA